MMLRPFRSLARQVVVLAAAVAMAIVGSGCLWGVVTDAQSGAPLRGVDVTFVDANGESFTTTTNEFGIYSFNQSIAPVPSTGNANVTIDAVGYGPATETRLIEFNEPGFSEVQSFSLEPPSNRYHQPRGKFSLTYPTGWDVEVPSDGTWLAGESPSSGDEAPAVCGALGGEKPDLSLAEQVFLVLTIFKGPTLTELPSLSPTTTQLDLAQATKLVISYRAEISGQEISFKDLLYFVERGDRWYAVDCSTLAGEYNGLLPQFEEIIQTFRTD